MGGINMLKGFRNFLMRGDVIVVAVGLVVALAFSNLVKAFTDNIINPLIASAQGGIKGPGLDWQLVTGGGDATYLNLGAFISAIIYFIIFMAVVYSRSSCLTNTSCRGWVGRRLATRLLPKRAQRACRMT
jgi:large conductance mechanosensitive channel protein